EKSVSGWCHRIIPATTAWCLLAPCSAPPVGVGSSPAKGSERMLKNGVRSDSQITLYIAPTSGQAGWHRTGTIRPGPSPPVNCRRAAVAAADHSRWHHTSCGHSSCPTAARRSKSRVQAARSTFPPEAIVKQPTADGHEKPSADIDRRSGEQE